MEIYRQRIKQELITGLSYEKEKTMTSKPDDLEAVRTLVATLSVFDATEQERIIRWTREKLGLAVSSRQSSTESRDRNVIAGWTFWIKK